MVLAAELPSTIASAAAIATSGVVARATLTAFRVAIPSTPGRPGPAGDPVPLLAPIATDARTSSGRAQTAIRQTCAREHAHARPPDPRLRVRAGVRDRRAAGARSAATGDDGADRGVAVRRHEPRTPDRGRDRVRRGWCPSGDVWQLCARPLGRRAAAGSGRPPVQAQSRAGGAAAGRVREVRRAVADRRPLDHRRAQRGRGWSPARAACRSNGSSATARSQRSRGRS